MLVHGWPDDVRCWDKIVPALVDGGHRVIAPYLRGTGPTSFLSEDTMRSGAIAALTEDLAEFLEALDLSDVVICGYDWGARAGYGVAALFPARLRGLVAMAAGYATSHPIKEIGSDLAKAYWFEWVVALKQGQEAMDKDRLRLARFLWATWSPDWPTKWQDFDEMAPSLQNDDWGPISIHAYLQRWKETPGAPEHEDVERRLAENPAIQLRPWYCTALPTGVISLIPRLARTSISRHNMNVSFSTRSAISFRRRHRSRPLMRSCASPPVDEHIRRAPPRPTDRPARSKIVGHTSSTG